MSVDVVNLDLRDTAVAELMDDPACDADRLAATLRRFRIVNRLFSGWGMLYRSDVSPFLASLARPALSVSTMWTSFTSRAHSG